MKRSILFVILFLSITFCSCAVMKVDQYAVSETSAEETADVSENEEISAISFTSAPDEEILSPEEAVINDMSIEEKLGQVILVRFPDEPVSMAEKYHFGGYTLYAKDIEGQTPESLSEKLSEIKAASPVPPFFAADEEGGEVVRISKYPAFAKRSLPSVQEMLAADGDVEAWANELADNLQGAGINLDLAPVADAAESKDDYIYSRTCGLGYEETGEVIGRIVSALNSRNIVSCLKHFPGYGPNVDTHTGIAVDTRSRESFESGDLIPFISGIKAGAPAVMVNHNIVEAYNAEIPASLSPEVHSVLRELGFEGIIISDDLGMDAISLYTDDPYADAFLAGNDLLCVSDGAACYDSLSAAYESGRITDERLNESVERIIKVKLGYGIIG